MERVEKFASPYFFEDKHVEVVRDQLENAGFLAAHIEVQDMIYKFQDINHLESEWNFISVS